MIYLFSGTIIDRTPIIKTFIASLQQESLVHEYVPGKRVKYIIGALWSLFKATQYDALIFIGAQSLPLLFLFQWKRSRIYYWSLESYPSSLNFFKGWPAFIQNFQQLIHWNRITLILPVPERREFYHSWNVADIKTVYNCPPAGQPFVRRSLRGNEPIKMVIYGNVNNRWVYLNEVCEAATRHASKMELHIIGSDIGSRRKNTMLNLHFVPLMPHDELLQYLQNMHGSFVGYRPVDFNHLYCAPNKLFEAFSLSLPVIGNIKNPTVKNVLEETGAGLPVDFDKLPDEIEKALNSLKDQYTKFSEKAYSAYVDKYNYNKINDWTP